MENITQSVNLSMTILKWTGGFLAIITILYFMLHKNMNDHQVHSWKKIIKLAIGAGIINAGINIVFGKTILFITPIILGIVLLFWVFKKLPLAWQGKHILVFCSIFVISSIVTFLGTGLIFFHLAIEGKI